MPDENTRAGLLRATKMTSSPSRMANELISLAALDTRSSTGCRIVTNLVGRQIRPCEGQHARRQCEQLAVVGDIAGPLQCEQDAAHGGARQVGGLGEIAQGHRSRIDAEQFEHPQAAVEAFDEIGTSCSCRPDCVSVSASSLSRVNRRLPVSSARTTGRRPDRRRRASRSKRLSRLCGRQRYREWSSPLRALAIIIHISNKCSLGASRCFKPKEPLQPNFARYRAKPCQNNSLAWNSSIYKIAHKFNRRTKIGTFERPGIIFVRSLP